MSSSINTAIGGRVSAIGVRRVRLVSGLVLFVYVASHLSVHALGNVSLGEMHHGLDGFRFVWQSLPGTFVLYVSFLVHLGLGLWALYERRTFRYKNFELPQLILGLLIPIVLLNHIVSTRVALVLDGTVKLYEQELYTFWVKSPVNGIGQSLLLLVAWVHGCIGLYFWLRLKPSFPRIRQILLGVAVLVPVLSLLGFYQGARVVEALARDQGWRDMNLSPIEVGTLAEQAQLATIRNVLWSIYGLAILGVLAARGLRAYREQRHGTMRLVYPDRRVVKAPIGLTILEASTRYEIPHAGVCGGRGRCGTCRVSVLEGRENLPAPSATEREVLDQIGAGSSVRLACQTRPTGDVTVVPLLPSRVGLAFVKGRRRRMPSQRRYAVSLFVELRDIVIDEGDAGRGHDLMFLTNRFLGAAAEAVRQAGGVPNRYYGNGMLALFGLDREPAAACRLALEAVGMTAVNVEHVNRLLERSLAEPVRFVVGLHGGEVTLGEVGNQNDFVYTALGPSVGEAAALVEQARLSGCEFMVSEEVCERAGLRRDVMTCEIVTLPGGRTMTVRTGARATAMFGALDTLVDQASQGPDTLPDGLMVPA